MINIDDGCQDEMTRDVEQDLPHDARPLDCDLNIPLIGVKPQGLDILVEGIADE